MNTLQEIAQRVSICTDCPLHKSRSRAVPGDGPEHAPIMFIGEAPGHYEDQQGRPFVGAAGRFLEELLASIGFQREEVFITNVVKCRPPGNRDPLPAEMNTCSQYLDKQLEVIKPRIVVTLGRYSLARFFPKETISRARGKPRRQDGVIFYPMFHPAAALHQQNLRRVIEEDMKAIPPLLKESLERQEPAVPPPQQLSMF